MNGIMQYLAFIMFLVVICVILYIIYDVINYKNSVDDSFDQTSNHMNESFSKVSENIESVQKDVESNADNLKKTNTEMNSVKETVNNNGTILTAKLEENEQNTLNFDTALKKYFTFYDNNQNLENDKLFEHIFSSISPNLDLRAHVNAMNGMIVNTPEEKSNSKNFRICNSLKNCISLNVNSEGFNITPEEVSNMTITSKSNKTLAKFDMANDSVYIGGSNTDAPFYVKDNDVFIKNVNMNQVISDVSDIKATMNQA
jgi:hypothetical protein